MRLTTLRIFGDELFNTPGDRILGIPKSSKRNSRRPPLGLLPALRSFKGPIPFEIAGLATLTSHFMTKVRLICGTSPKQPYIRTCYQQVTLALEIASAYGRRETTGASISANAKLQPRFHIVTPDATCVAVPILGEVEIRDRIRDFMTGVFTNPDVSMLWHPATPCTSGYAATL